MSRDYYIVVLYLYNLIVLPFEQATYMIVYFAAKGSPTHDPRTSFDRPTRSREYR